MSRYARDKAEYLFAAIGSLTKGGGRPSAAPSGSKCREMDNRDVISDGPVWLDQFPFGLLSRQANKIDAIGDRQ